MMYLVLYDTPAGCRTRSACCRCARTGKSMYDTYAAGIQLPSRGQTHQEPHCGMCHASVHRSNKRSRGCQALKPHLQRPALSEAMGPSHFFLRNRQKSQLFRSGCVTIVEGIVVVGPAAVRSDGIDATSWSGCCPLSPSWETGAEGAASLGIAPSSGIKVHCCCSSIVLC